MIANRCWKASLSSLAIAIVCYCAFLCYSYCVLLCAIVVWYCVLLCVIVRSINQSTVLSSPGFIAPVFVKRGQHHTNVLQNQLEHGLVSNYVYVYIKLCMINRNHTLSWLYSAGVSQQYNTALQTQLYVI